MRKICFAILLSFLMVLSGGALVFAEDYIDGGIYKNSTAPLLVNTLNYIKTYDGAVGTPMYFRLIPDMTDYYTIETIGTVDTEGELFNSSGATLDICDDVVGVNFRIHRLLNEGETYYLRVTNYSMIAGDQTILRIIGDSGGNLLNSFDIDSLTYTVLTEPDGTTPGTVQVKSKDTSIAGEITIPSIISFAGDDYTVTQIGENAFYDCSGLTGNITIPDSVTNIGSQAFAGLSELTSMTFLSANAPAVATNSFGSDNYIIYIPHGGTGYDAGNWTNYSDRIALLPAIDAAAPVITNNLSTTQVEYNQNEPAAALDASATVTDGGAISYAWYSNTTNSTEGATALGVTTPTYTPSTAVVGTTYYFCVVTNTNNEAIGATTAQSTSNIANIKVNASVVIEDFEGWGFVNATPALSAGMYIHDPWKFVAKVDGVAANPGAIELWTGPAALSISTGAGIVDELHILKINGNKFNFIGFNFTGTSNRTMVVTGWRDGVQATQPQIINYTSLTNDEFFGMSSEDSEFKNVDEIRICGVDLGGGDYDKISGYLESFTYDMIPVDEVAPRVSSLTMTSDNANTELAKAGDTISLHITVNEDIQSPTVTIANQNAAVSDAGDSDARTWEATYTMQEEDASGVVPFTLDFRDLAGNVAAQVTAVTSGNPVIFDKTPPSAPTAVTVTPVGGTVAANSLNSSNTNLTATATIIAAEATGGKAELYIGGILCATDNTIAADDTQVTFDLGTSTNAGLQAAVPSGGIVSVKLYDAAGNSSTSSAANPTLIVDYTPALSDAERLQAAIDAAANGDTITLEDDIDLGTTGVTVTNKTITLDLNGKTMTYSGTAAAVTLSGAANLTVQDSGTSGTITSASDCCILLNNGSGTLTLASGTIKGTGTANTFGIANQGTGRLNITGGTVQTTKMYALLIKANSGDVTISGGTLKATGWGVINHNGNTAKLTISGNALIECTGTDASGKCFSINNQTASLEIQGGRIIGDRYIASRGAVEISGGYIQPKIYSYYNITVKGGFLDDGLGFYSTGTGIVNGGYIYPSTDPLINSAGDLLKIYSVQVRDAGNNTVNNTPVTSLSTDPVLDYAYGLNDVQTDVGGKLFVWLPEGITWFSVTAGGSTYSGAVTLNASYGYYEGTLRLASQNPAADVTTVAKTSAAQASVDFTLTTAPTGTWKVYDSETATDVMTGVSAALSGTTLTLSTSEGSIAAGTYYVSVTEPNKNESARLTLTVEPIANAAAPVITNNLSTTQVEYNQNAAAAALDASATVTDGGAISYAWYSNTTNSTDGATALGVTTPTYTPSTAVVGTTYYFCVVTNTNNEATGATTAQTTSAIACIKVNALVDAAAPVITNNLSTTQVQYNQNAAAAALDASATVTDGGAISYAWYSNTTNSTDGATALGVTTPTYTPSTAVVGTTYYFCVVTNTNNEATGATTAQTTSNIASIKVNALVDAAAPVITNNLSTTQVQYNQNAAAAALDASAIVTDGGAISYAWYSNTTNSTDGATALGVTTPTYTPSTAVVGTTYYFCVVTNTNNEATGATTSQTTSNIASIKVNAASSSPSGGSSSSSSTVSDTPVITVAEVKSEIFNNTEDIKVEADVTSAFGQSVEVKITDDTDAQKEIFSLAGANDKVYPFDISLYSKQSGEKIQPKDGYSVKITLPVPQELLDDREKIKVVYGKDGKMETLKSELTQKDGKWYITFEAFHFSPYALIVSAESSQPWSNPFSDVREGDWYYAAVQYAAQNGLMKGTGSNTFSPELVTTRGMIATILYNLDGSKDAELSTFKDVNPGAYYAHAVAWAQKQGIIAGYGNGMFGPDDSITREQLAAMLWKYAGSPAAADSQGLATFKDGSEISAYAQNALAWAIQAGIINGKGAGLLDPKGQATRAEAAQILRNFLQESGLTQ